MMRHWRQVKKMLFWLAILLLLAFVSTVLPCMLSGGNSCF